MSFEQMLEESLKTIHNGEVVEGTVIDVKEDEIILNIGYKADGIITKSEYTNDSSVNLQDVVHDGSHSIDRTHRTCYKSTVYQLLFLY